MTKQKIEIKLQSKASYYFDLIKKNMIGILKLIISILVISGTLYIGFHILLFFIVIILFSYLLNKLKT